MLNMMPPIATVLSLQTASSESSSILAVRRVESINQQSSAASDQVHTRWSRQDIFTLVSVCVGVIGIFIAVLVASPVLREWLYRPLRCEFTSSHV